MTKIIDKKYIFYVIAGITFLIFLAKAGGYILVDFLDEAKFVAVSSEMKNWQALFLPYLDGKITFGAGIFYYSVIKLSSAIFGKFGEIAVRIPSLICAFSLLAIVYNFVRRTVNQKFAVIAALTLFANIAFIVYSSIASQGMLTACLIITAVLSCCMPVFINDTEYKYRYYFLFWIFALLAALSGEISCIILPFIIILPVLAVCGKLKEFFIPKNMLLGFLIMVLFILSYFYVGHRLYSYDFIYFIVNSSVPKIFHSDLFPRFLHYMKNGGIYFIMGGMPWVLSFLTVFAALIVKLFKEVFCYKTDLRRIYIDDGRKFFLISLWAMFCSFVYGLIWYNGNLDIFLPFFFFMSFVAAYYWYRNICFDAHKKAIFVPSLLFYLSLVLLTCLTVGAFFFLPPIQKDYVEPVMIPVMVITLLISVPGLIAVVIKRKVVNFGMHIAFSVLFFFFLTGLFYNYISSLGENDLVSFSEKARQDDAMLVAYNLPEKYSMIYYYHAPVIFNGEMSADKIYNNYGDTRNVYLVLKHTDLAYFDKFFVYEIVATGKHYCEITNIKYLPNDEIDADKGEEA